MVGPLFVGSVGLPETHNFFQSALAATHRAILWTPNVSPVCS